MADLRTPAEIKYDAERDGSAYVKPQPSTLLLAVADYAEQIEIAAEADRLMDEDERAIIVWILEMVEERFGAGE